MERTQADSSAEWWKPERVEADWWSARAAAREWIPPASAVPFWATIAFTAVLLFSPQAYFPALEAVRPAMIPAVIGLGAYVLDRFSQEASFFMRARELWLLAAFLLWALITAPLSIWPGGSFAFLGGQYLKTIAIFWVLSHSAVTLMRLRQTAWSLSIMAVGLGLFAVNNYLSGVFIDQTSNQDRVVGNEGALTKNPNDLALMVNIIIPLTMALLLSSKRPGIRMTLLGMLAVEGLTVFLTFSRGGFLTLGAILLIYAWKLRRRAERVWIYAVFVLALLSLPLLPASYFERMSTIIHTEKDATGSASERWTDMTIAARQALSSPVIGSGVGMNELAMNEARGGGWRRVHNVYLELMVDLGLPGLALFLALLVACLRSTAEVQRRAAELPDMQDLVHLAQAVQISLVAFALAAMFHPVTYHPYFYYLAALAIATHAVSRTMRMSCASVPAPIQPQ
jgi:probable O-glycosylation ligase (exosortase A-associated)